MSWLHLLETWPFARSVHVRVCACVCLCIRIEANVYSIINKTYTENTAKKKKKSKKLNVRGPMGKIKSNYFW